MKKILMASLVFFSFFYANAQNAKSVGMPNIGHVYGKIIDSATGKAIDEVSVLMLQTQFDTATKSKKDILLTGITTKGNGDFAFSDLPVMGALQIQISAIGYAPVTKKVAFDMTKGVSGFNVDMGNLALHTDSKQLAGVTVVASKPLMRMDIDKKVFNVDKNLVSAGGTALDVMRNVPSVMVDIDGGVKLRNASPQIFVDGRPSTLSLEQIPADAIESIEVITNPSAKYDASGGNAGILNIVLKKNRKSGYNGFIMAGADSRGGSTLMGNFNLRQDKFNFTGTVFNGRVRSRATGNTERLNLLSEPNILVSQDNVNKSKGAFVFGRIGIDYFLNNRTTLSVAGIKVQGKFTPNEVIDVSFDSLFSNGSKSSFSNRYSNNTTNFNSTGLQAGLKHNFKTDGEELTADFTLFSSKTDGDGMFTTEYIGSNSASTNTTRQKLLWGGDNQFITLQTDYVKPFDKNKKLEAGLRAQLNTVKNNTQNFYQSNGNGDFIELPFASTNYTDNNNVYAAYGSFTHSFKNFGYKVGLRAESSKYEGELKSTSQQFGNEYPISLFPSLFLSQKLKNQQELQLSYTRRISRPGFSQLIPFTNYTDSLNITRGNPNLVPSFTNSVEASYSKNYKGGNNFLASVYYKLSNDLITSFLDKSINPVTGKEDVINTYINANSSYSAGAEFTSVNKPTKWLDVTTNINIYNSKINTDEVFAASQDARWSWFGKINTSWKLPKKYNVQLSANYQSKTNLPIGVVEDKFSGGSQAQSAAQGYINSYWAMDIAVRKSIFKGDAGALTLSMSDVFRTRKIEQHSESNFFVQDYSRLNNPQLVKLTFTFRFGKFDTSLFKRQNNKSQQDPMQGGMQGIPQ